MVFYTDVRPDASAGCELCNNFHPAGGCDFDQVIENAIRDIFVIGTMIAILLEVQLQRFQFETKLFRYVCYREGTEIRLSCFRAHRREFGTNGFDFVITLRMRVLKCFQNIGVNLTHVRRLLF